METEKPFSGGWWDKRNERRKREYAENPEVRAQIQERERENYRTKRGSVAGKADRLDQTTVVGTQRSVEVPGVGLIQHATLTLKEVAAVLDMTPKQVGKWASDGRLPPPVARPVNPAGPPVYLKEEVEAMLPPLVEHYRTIAYYRTDHTQTVSLILLRVRQAREKIGVAA